MGALDLPTTLWPYASAALPLRYLLQVCVTCRTGVCYRATWQQVAIAKCLHWLAPVTLWRCWDSLPQPCSKKH